MPDWTYHTIFKPALDKMPAAKSRNFIHRGMNAVSSFPGGGAFIEILGHTEPSEKLQSVVAGLALSNPVGLSGKIDPLLAGTAAFGNLGFGFIEVGPVSAEPQNGKAVHFNETTGRIAFSRQGESRGVNETRAKLKNFKKPLLIRIDPEASIEETLQITASLRDSGDAFITANPFTANDFQALRHAAGNKPLLYACNHANLDLPRLSELAANGWIDGILVEERSVESPFGTNFLMARRLK
ncbi:hypothetical protein QMA09_16015 [Planococcus sp. APC 3906]|uniref:hypothetical protein n=1 Tax=Planococcus sp. APC 3906 TaxID=3035194 RepID=UPI0025B4C171|nr:hypothetical protein [Planococcus sp. APC 3906]MDN3451704.1 hypothetical protein [Planococcus sp. APC 3906]